MADVIKEVAETAKEVDVQAVETVIEGPTIFKTSNTAKIVFGVVAGVAAAYGVYKGVRCVLKRKALKNSEADTDISNDFDEAEFKEVDDLDEE